MAQERPHDTGLWRSDLVVGQGWVWGLKLPLQNQDEEPTVGPSCAMMSDIWGRVQGSFLSLLSYF